MNKIDILLVEDNYTDAQLITRMLKKEVSAGILYHVRNGEEALRFLFRTGPYASLDEIQCRPKLILLDIQMPKVNGLEVLERIKRDPATQAIPVVVFSSSAENNDISACYALGANSYVVKPLEYDLLAAIMTHLAEYWMRINKVAARL